MDILTIVFLAELAFSPTTANKINDPYMTLWATTPEQVVEANLGVGVRIFDLVTVEGRSECFMVPPDGSTWMFSPYQADFYFGAYVEFEGFTLGFEHLCRHPIINGTDNVATYQGGYDRFYLRYVGEIDVWRRKK